MFCLRLYQENAITEAAVKIGGGCRSLILVSPTGSGKTIIGSHIILKAITKGNQTLFLAHRKELVDQCSKKLAALSLPHGIIMAGHPYDSLAPIQVASLQTANRRELPAGFRLIIIDECHHAAAESYKKILEQFPDAVVIGLTATPYRADGEGLGDVFQDWVRVATIQDLTDKGFLVPCRYWSPGLPQLAGVRRKGADFESESLGAEMSKPKLIGDVVKNYQAIAGGERGICFAVNKFHAQALTDAFNEAKVSAAFLHDSTGKKERERILAWHRLGKYLILVNVGILSEGYDDPAVSVCIQARPTLSVGLHIQQIGRVLRPFSGKTFAKVIDHAGNCRRLGLMEDHPVDLEGGLKKKLKRNEDDIAPALKTCRECYAIFPAALDACPCCGVEAKGPVRTIITKEGDLKELTKPSCACGSFDTIKQPSPQGAQIVCAGCGLVLRTIKPDTTPSEYYAQKLKECQRNGWKTARAGVMFKVRYGYWPDSKVRSEATI